MAQLAGASKRVRRDLLVNGNSGASTEGVKDPEFGGKKRLRPRHAAVSPFLGSYALSRLVPPPTRLPGALVARLDASWPKQRRRASILPRAPLLAPSKPRASAPLE